MAALEEYEVYKVTFCLSTIDRLLLMQQFIETNVFN